MKCITYGYFVLFVILLSFVTTPLMFASPTAGSIVSAICMFALFGWWIVGFFDDCSDGYYGNLRRA